MTDQRSGFFPRATLVGERRELTARSVVELIGKFARTTPEAVAVESAGSSTSFRRLWERAGSIAAALRDMDVQAGEIIGVVARRDAETVSSMLAIMALRAAYVPIDPTNPPGRVQLMLEQAKPRFVLCNGPEDTRHVFGLPSLNTADVPAERNPAEPWSPAGLPHADDVAYVVFTSGSTGTPKGVLVEHRSLVNYAGWSASHIMPDGDGAACPVFASMGFDLALTTLWVPLAHGRAVVMVGGAEDYGSLFAERPRLYDFVKATPSHFRLFERILRPDYHQVTRRLMIGGEPLEPELLARMAGRLRGVQVVNHYGPTETTIGCCAYRFTVDRMPDLPTVPIGRPAWNTAAYVIDDTGRLASAGGHGELIVAGFGIARGYLGGDGSRFLDLAEFGGRAYRTGDIVEVRPEGVLLHLGRADSQLKINGHRFEMAELHRHALSVPRVIDAAFEVTRGNTFDLVEAFVVLDGRVGQHAPSEQEIRAHLSGLLPPELVPRRVHVVPQIRIDANGKRDLRGTRALVEGGTGRSSR